MRVFRSFAAVTVLVALAGCDLSTAPDVPAPVDPADDTYASSLGVDIGTMTRTSSGLYFKDKVVGTGDAAALGDSVQGHYTLWLTNGTKVESSKDPGGELVEFRIGGPNNIIAGFQEGFIGMKPGGVRQLVVPPHLAWGTAGRAPVQPNANVVFEIDYLSKL